MSKTGIKERPMLFSGSMVEALLNDRKTQTRRIAKGDKCPYGKVGDRIWVKETWQAHERESHGNEPAELFEPKTKPSLLDRTQCKITYRSSYFFREIRWRSPLFMMRWMSRITLEVTEIKRERLFDITDEDCLGEGIRAAWEGPRPWHDYLSQQCGFASPKDSFKSLWLSINGKDSWVDQDVWVVKFKRVES